MVVYLLHSVDGSVSSPSVRRLRLRLTVTVPVTVTVTVPVLVAGVASVDYP